MRLKTVGVICPDCSEPMSYVGKLCQSDTWIGFTRCAWCNCDATRAFAARSWLLLYNERKIFVGIIPGDDPFLRSAGEPIWTFGEIPF